MVIICSFLFSYCFSCFPVFSSQSEFSHSAHCSLHPKPSRPKHQSTRNQRKQEHTHRERIELGSKSEPPSPFVITLRQITTQVSETSTVSEFWHDSPKWPDDQRFLIREFHDSWFMTNRIYLGSEETKGSPGSSFSLPHYSPLVF